ncbi:MAG: hypothetical protein AB7Q00_06855 [Phycisphaerales bacterium]|nr:MAG: hypothetical protein IPK69_11545 [Phycisphaerales bacterium]
METQPVSAALWRTTLTGGRSPLGRVILAPAGMAAGVLGVLACSSVALATESAPGEGRATIPEALLNDGVLVPSIVGAVIVGIVLIRSVSGVMKTSARERTRREIAAYIAEGSMTPEQGERLMKAGKNEA